MSRYEAMFARGEGVFGAFVMLGDPGLRRAGACSTPGRGGRGHDEVGIPSPIRSPTGR